MKWFNLQLFADEQGIQTQNTDTQVQTNAGQTPTRIQQIEELSKEEIQARLLEIQDEKTALVQAAKKFEVGVLSKAFSWVKGHGVEVGLLAVILARLFGWL